MSVPVLANQSQSSGNDSLGNSNNPVSIDLDDDVIMQTPATVSERNDFSTETELRDGLRRLDDLYFEVGDPLYCVMIIGKRSLIE
jgi:hypothetical protein